MPRISKSMLLLVIGVAATVFISTTHGFQDNKSEIKKPDKELKSVPRVTRLRKTNKAEEKIEQALQQETQIEFVDTPLSDAVAFFSKLHGIIILIDKPALEEEGISLDEPLTLSLDGVKLSSALNIILKPLKMDYVIEDEVLKLTTVFKVEEIMTVSVYDIRKLLKAGFELQMLMNTIMAHTGEWTAIIGSGGESSSQPGSIVVLQTEKTHQEIMTLLELLGQMTVQPVKPKE